MSLQGDFRTWVLAVYNAKLFGVLAQAAMDVPKKYSHDAVLAAAAVLRLCDTGFAKNSETATHAYEESLRIRIGKDVKFKKIMPFLVEICRAKPKLGFVWVPLYHVYMGSDAGTKVGEHLVNCKFGVRAYKKAVPTSPIEEISGFFGHKLQPRLAKKKRGVHQSPQEGRHATMRALLSKESEEQLRGYIDATRATAIDSWDMLGKSPFLK